jgi:hypothetical protein
MKYDIKAWRERVSQRSDISCFLTHLTKPQNINGVPHESVEVLIKILKERKLVGSTRESGFIVGTTPAVCFQEAPIHGIAQNVYYEEKLRLLEKHENKRYEGYGLSFLKPYVYNNGGRPVIYDRTDEAKKYLNKSEYWRIVNFDMSDENRIIDWTHEREWRVPNDFVFDLSQVYVLVPNSKAYRKFVDLADQEILQQIRSISYIGIVLF